MNIIVRHSPPHKFDEAPKGTICRVINGFDEILEEYIQRSENPEEPRWEKI